MALVVIGGVAAGLSAASRARRIDPRLPITVLEKGPVISYGACGLPYLVEGRVHKPEQLIVYTPEFFRKERNIEVRTGARVVSIAHPRREVVLDSGERLRYDRLVIATGGRCDTSGIEGAAAPHVFTLHTLEDAERLRGFLRDRRPRLPPSSAPATSGSRSPTLSAARACASPCTSAPRTLSSAATLTLPRPSAASSSSTASSCAPALASAP